MPSMRLRLAPGVHLRDFDVNFLSVTISQLHVRSERLRMSDSSRTEKNMKRCYRTKSIDVAARMKLKEIL